MAELAALLGGTATEMLENYPFSVYRSLEGMNPSTLVHGLKSMRHLQHACTSSRPDTDDLRWGRAVHSLLFEPHEFATKYVMWPQPRRGKVWIEFRDKAEKAGQEVLTADQYSTAQIAAMHFITEPLVQEVIAKGVPEASFRCPIEGVQCKGRVDWICTVPGKECIVDLKTTKNVEAKAFGRDFFNYAYHVKLAMYQRMHAEAVGGELLPVKVIAIEKKPPYDVTIQTVPDAWLELGFSKACELLGDFKKAVTTGKWHGVAKGAEYYIHEPYGALEEGLIYDIPEDAA
jgi:hypothetical protein